MSTPQAASCHWVRPPETVAGIFLRRFDRSPCLSQRYSLSSPYSLILSPCALDCSCLSDCTLCFQVVRRKPHAAGYPSRRKPHAAGYPSRRKPHARPRWLLTLCSLSLSRSSCRVSTVLSIALALLSLCSPTLPESQPRPQPQFQHLAFLLLFMSGCTVQVPYCFEAAS